MNPIYKTNDTLMHYGVLGMKWGRKKAYTNSVSESRTSTKTEYDKPKRRNMPKEVTLVRGIMRGIGTKVVLDVSSSAFSKAGKKGTANALKAMGTLSMTAIIGSSVYQSMKPDD